MKQKFVGLALWALAIAVGITVVTPMRAQSQNPAPSQQQEQQAQTQQKSGTFVGEIVKTSNGQFALLTDKDHGRGFFLDNQEKAKQFEGKAVKVTGVLDASTSTIHVTDIVPA